MVKKLIRHGNSAAFVIDEPILEQLHITDETSFELSTDGENIILTPQDTAAEENNILESLRKINKEYGTVLSRLGE
ncbi:MAG: AbrB/MazE/SpoVT family DNA-binding domain-containing protein [Treponema sp.]|jgi:antitoxin component of MazEF toxin-antitoxin module|nr:AbrB/MazE/SpoVT family DNA-binding domain-containing protein [Treponema sp.]